MVSRKKERKIREDPEQDKKKKVLLIISACLGVCMIVLLLFIAIFATPKTGNTEVYGGGHPQQAVETVVADEGVPPVDDSNVVDYSERLTKNISDWIPAIVLFTTLGLILYSILSLVKHFK
jgi:hypothetical protein